MVRTSEAWGSLQLERVETHLTITCVDKSNVDKFAFYKARIVTEFSWKYLNQKASQV